MSTSDNVISSFWLRLGESMLLTRRVAPSQRAPAMLPVAGADSVEPGAGARFTLPYVRNIAMFVVLTSASTAIIDFLMKSHARASFGSGPELLRFFALFYGVIQLLSFLAQTQSATVLQRLGVRVLNVLPGSVGTAGTATITSRTA